MDLSMLSIDALQAELRQALGEARYREVLEISVRTWARPRQEMTMEEAEAKLRQSVGDDRANEMFRTRDVMCVAVDAVRALPPEPGRALQDLLRFCATGPKPRRPKLRLLTRLGR